MITAWHDFHFLRPYWLLALPVLWGFVVLLARRRGRDGDWAALIDPDLLPGLRLNDGEPPGRTPWPWLFLAYTLAALALAGPSWERAPSPAFRGNAAWVIVLDLSPSMMAADLAPDRVTRARYAIDDLLSAARDVRVGLVVSGGEDYTVAPLTDDVATIRALLPPLSPDIMPVAGDDLAPALNRAGDLLRQAGIRNGHVVVLSDGFSDPVAAFGTAGKLRAEGDEVDTVGIGTPGGAPLVGTGGGFQKDAQGGVGIAHFDAGLLRQLAASGGGRYVDLANLNELIGTLQSSHERLDEARNRTDVRVADWLDGGVWLLPLILVAAALLGRRGWL